MALLTRSQRVFGSELARQLGPGARTELIGGWLFNEMNGGAAATREANRDYNWLNIGWTDSGQRGTGNQAWRDPVSAARHTARWLRGEWDVPGFGRAAPGIQKFAQTVAQGKSLNAQMSALRNSGWASSGYPDLPGIVQQHGGKFGLRGGGRSAPALGGNGNGGAAAPRRQGLSTVSVGQADTSGIASALASAAQSSLPQVQSAGLIASPNLPMPEGYRPVLTGGVARRESPLRSALTQISQSQVAEVTVRLPQLAPGGEPRQGGRGRGGLDVPQRSAEPIARAIQWAARRVGTAETGTNSGPKISDWQKSISPNLAGQPWCGVFVGKALQAAGVKGIDARIAYVPYIHEDASSGRGPFERLVSAKDVRPGDVVGWGGRHTGLVTQVNKDGSFQTIEGNSSDAVSYRTYKKGQAGSDVFFARPRYRG